MAEYVLILSRIRNGSNETAIRTVETCLDLTIENAELRRRHLSGAALEDLDRVLRHVANYRQEHPRSLDTNNYSDAWLKVYLTREKQAEIDEFLRRFLTPPQTNGL